MLAVMVTHAAYGHYLGGFLGVEVFFVLSGYLITGLLVKEFSTTGRILRRFFYARRALRLAPALGLGLILANLISTYAPPLLGYRLPIGWSDLAVVLYVGNWVEFVRPGSLGYLSHTWSLAIEEQFYLAWPLVLAAVLPRFSLARIWKGALVGSIAFAVFTAITYDLFRANIFATNAHLPGLLLGGTLAIYLADGPRRSPCESRWLALGFGAFLALLSLRLTPVMPLVLNGGLFAADFAAVMVIAHCVAGSTFITRLLENRVLVAIGRISYGLYVFHYPTFLLLEQFRIAHDNLNFVELTAARFAITFAIATLSYLLLERRFLKMKQRWSVVARPLDQPVPVSYPA